MKPEEINQLLLLSIGSNIRRSVNIDIAKRELRKLLGPTVKFTPTLLTAPIDMTGPKFLNLLATADCRLPYPVLREKLKAIEQLCGNSREKRALGIVELDIDILSHLGIRHHEKDWKRPYINELITMLTVDNG